jgi:hypothetical protein
MDDVAIMIWRFVKSDCRQRHGLFVLAAPHRHAVFHLNQRFGKARHVAMAKNAEDAGEQRLFLAVDHDELVDKIAHQALGHGQTDGGHVGKTFAGKILEFLFQMPCRCNMNCKINHNPSFKVSKCHMF